MIEKLKGHIPDFILAQLQLCADKYGINNPLRMAHFLGTCAEETGNFTVFEENLNYSAERMHAVWPGEFPTIESAKPYEYQPEKLANFIYAGKIGNTLPDSGWKWRGRGPIQLTGYNNYLAFSNFVHNAEILVNPDLINTRYQMESAAYFWDSKKLNDVAEGGISDGIIHVIAGKVNGNPNGNFDARKAETLKFYNLLNS